jgi:hypothetical protein
MPTVDQGGNAFGTTMVVGTTDGNNMNFIRNGNLEAVITAAGLAMPASKGIVNLSSTFNASILPAASGTVITRSIADTNPPLIVNRDGGTGNIQLWQDASTSKAFVDGQGIFGGAGLKNSATGNNAYVQVVIMEQ